MTTESEKGEISTDKIPYIIDTKWKVIDKDKPNDSDLKQMYAYNMYWEANRSILPYPATTQTDGGFGKFHQGREGINECKVGFINVLNDEGELDDGIGSEILRTMNSK